MNLESNPKIEVQPSPFAKKTLQPSRIEGKLNEN